MLSESHAVEKKQLVNEIVSLKKQKDSYERESSRREIHVKQIQNEANRGLDALHDSEEKIQILSTQVMEFNTNLYPVMLIVHSLKCLARLSAYWTNQHNGVVIQLDINFCAFSWIIKLKISTDAAFNWKKVVQNV